jgi:hypothetical protein
MSPTLFPERLLCFLFIVQISVGQTTARWPHPARHAVSVVIYKKK